MPSIKLDAFVGVRHSVDRHLVCAMAGQFPVLDVGPNDELAAVYRVGAGHYGVMATLATSRSTDGGKTWGAPIEVRPRGEDVRNPAFAILPDGRWLLAYWEAGVYCYPVGDDGERRWKDPTDGGEAADMFVITSSDHGASWSAPSPYRSERLAYVSPFGRIIVLPDGDLMMPAYGHARGEDPNAMEAITLRSRDGGATWGDETVVMKLGNEMSLCVVGTKVVAAVRHMDASTMIVTSTDAGRTWSGAHRVTRVNEHPADLCVLQKSGRLMMSFGRRMRPIGAGALTSGDAGATWDHAHEVMLAGDGIGNDVGYPSTAQLSDGTLVTVMYFARGSAAADGRLNEWGETSCQALRYPESLVVP